MDRVDPTQAPADDRGAGGPIAHIEATLEPDLNRYPAGADTFCDQEGAHQVRGQRFLAERGEPGIQGPPYQLSMGAGLCTDGDSVQACPEQRTDVDRGFAVELLGRCLCSGGISVGHHNLLDTVQALESRCVKSPDPTNSHQANTHAPTLLTLDPDGA